MSCHGFHPPESKFSLRSKILIIIGIIFLFFIAVVLPSEGAEIHGNYVIVEKGDSLSSISKQVFGKHSRWKEIQEMNGLEGTVIHPGQKLFFAVELSHTDQLIVANIAAYRYMQDWFKRRHGKRDYNLENDSWDWAMAPMMGQRSPQIHYNLWETRRRLEWIDLVAVKMGIATHVQGKAEHVFLLTAIAEQESGYRNLDGTHSEKGPFQIKPTTAAHYLKEEAPTDSIFYFESFLEDIGNSTYASYKVLKGLGLDKKPLRKVIESYNGGSKKKEYATQVLKRYNKIRTIYTEMTIEFHKAGVSGVTELTLF
jgi:LysM repeat protein